MSKNSRLNPSWPLWAVGTSAAILGGLACSVIVMTNHVSFANESARQMSVLKSRIAILEVALNQAQPYVMRLDAAEQHTLESTPPAPEILSPARAAPEAPKAPTPAPIVAKPVAAPAQHVSPAIQKARTLPPAARAAPAPAPKPEPMATPTPAPIRPAAAPEEPPRALKIEGVTSAKAGIRKLHPDMVEFISGRRVRKGESFPSGEKLLAVDPSTGRIITNQRQLIIFDQ